MRKINIGSNKNCKMNPLKENDFEYIVRGNFIVGRTLSFKSIWYKSRIIRWILYISSVWFYYLIMAVAALFMPKIKSGKYKVAVCAIFKNEGRFLKEWIDYHLEVGVERFYLYNNNSDDDYMEVLEPYIESGIIILHQWTQNHAQMECYRDCYFKYKHTCEWLGFIDIDEFVCPTKELTIGDWLNRFSNKPSVAIYWKQFGSNGLLKHNQAQLVIEQYTQCWPKLSTFTKMLLNTRFNHVIGSQMHVIDSKIYGINVPPINQFGNIIKYGINIGRKIIDIQINHYWGKALDEFLNKINNSSATHQTNEELKRMRLQRLLPHENMCKDRDFKIQRFLLQTKMAWENKKQFSKDLLSE